MNSKTIIGAIAALALIAVGGVVYYLNRPAPEAASIDNALEAVASEGTGDDAEGGAEEAATLTDASGTWSVNTEIGEFDFADATSTFVGFRVDEELTSVGATEAVGRTPAVSGDLVIAGTTVESVTIEADFTALVSDIPRRDDAMMRALNVTTNPSATFVLTDPIDFGSVPAEGERITFTAAGDLTVNGITNPVEIDLEAEVADGNLLIAGNAPVVFADYDVTAPQAGPVVAIADNGTIEVQLWFSQS